MLRQKFELDDHAILRGQCRLLPKVNTWSQDLAGAACWTIHNIVVFCIPNIAINNHNKGFDVIVEEGCLKTLREVLKLHGSLSSDVAYKILVICLKVMMVKFTDQAVGEDIVNCIPYLLDHGKSNGMLLQKVCDLTYIALKHKYGMKFADILLQNNTFLKISTIIGMRVHGDENELLTLLQVWPVVLQNLLVMKPQRALIREIEVVLQGTIKIVESEMRKEAPSYEVLKKPLQIFVLLAVQGEKDRVLRLFLKHDVIGKLSKIIFAAPESDVVGKVVLATIFEEFTGWSLHSEGSADLTFINPVAPHLPELILSLKTSRNSDNMIYEVAKTVVDCITGLLEAKNFREKILLPDWELSRRYALALIGFLNIAHKHWKFQISLLGKVTSVFTTLLESHTKESDHSKYRVLELSLLALPQFFKPYSELAMYPKDEIEEQCLIRCLNFVSFTLILLGGAAGTPTKEKKAALTCLIEGGIVDVIAMTFEKCGERKNVVFAALDVLHGMILLLNQKEFVHIIVKQLPFLKSFQTRISNQDFIGELGTQFEVYIHCIRISMIAHAFDLIEPQEFRMCTIEEVLCFLEGSEYMDKLRRLISENDHSNLIKSPVLEATSLRALWRIDGTGHRMLVTKRIKMAFQESDQYPMVLLREMAKLAADIVQEPEGILLIPCCKKLVQDVPDKVIEEIFAEQMVLLT